MNNNEEEKVRDNWNRIWKQYNVKYYQFEKLFNFVFKQYFCSKSIYKIIKKEIEKEKYENLSIIECGCGSGLIQKRLLKENNCQADFLDVSNEALKYVQHSFDHGDDKGRKNFILGSIFSMPVKDNVYDIVWNAGVLEHFDSENQKKAIREMYRIAKNNGKIIIIVPSIYGKLYLKMKKRAEKYNLWEAGKERPVSTIKNLVRPIIQSYDDYKEFSVGFISQLLFLKYLFKNKFFRNLSILPLEIIQNLLFFLEKFPGYLLVGIIKKHDKNCRIWQPTNSN